MPRRAYIVSPGFDGTDATNYCYGPEEDRDEIKADVLERIAELLEEGATVTAYEADDDLPACQECEAEDCEMREETP